MLSLRIAFRNILRHRRRSLLSGLTLLCGYVLLSFFVGLTDGTYESVIDAFTRDHTGHIQIHRKGYLDRPGVTKTIDDPEAVAKTLSNVFGVVAFAPRVLGPALAFAHGRSTPAEIRGIDPILEPRTTRLAGKLKEGRLVSTEAGSDGLFDAVIGRGIADSLRLAVGDEIILISQGADGSIANDRFRLVGISGGREDFEASVVFLSINTARRFFSLTNEAHEFAVLLESPGGARSIAERIDTALTVGGSRIEQKLAVDAWQEVEQDFYRAMQTDRRGNFISLGIILTLVAVGVLNAILMTILERTREYGVMKAIGTRPDKVFNLIMLESGILAVLSVAAGAIVAIPLNAWFAKWGIALKNPIEVGGMAYDRIVSEVSVNSLVIPALTVLLTALVVSVFPALRAARIRVVDALRSV